MNQTSASPRRRPLVYALYFAGWTLLGLWLGIDSLLGQHGQFPRPAPWEPLTWELSSALVTGALALLVAGFEAHLPLVRGSLLRHLPLHVAGAIAFSLLHVAGMVAMRKAVYLVMGSHYVFGGFVPLFYEMQKDLLTYVVIVGACMLLRTLRERHRRELDALRLAKELDQARLAQLGTQLEPHFLFNALNTIAARMHEDVDAADRLLVALADLLRTALASGDAPFAPVSREIEWLRSYCALMAERQPGQLHVRIEVDDATMTARIPRLMLQPLVENSFRHGLSDGRGHLRISLRSDNGSLLCSIRDDGGGYRPDREGVGLRNVRERLQLLYGQRAHFNIAVLAEGGTEATLQLPLEPCDA